MRMLRRGVAWPGARAGGLSLLAALLLTACWPGLRSPQGADLDAALTATLTDWGVTDSVTVAGIRLDDGKRSPETGALDEALLSAALHADWPVRADAGIAGSARAADLGWRSGEVLPRDWRDLPRGYVAGGVVRAAGRWHYLRLVLADPQTGEVVRSATLRLSQEQLARHTAQRQKRLVDAQEAVLPDIDMELHLLVRRDEGGFPRLVDFVEGGQLEENDRLQLRFRSGQDCEVFVFLYRSDGHNEVLYDGVVFAGRWNFAPGENAWRSLSVADEVTTVYLLASHRIEEDKTTMWETIERLQSQGQIDKFEGFDQVDAAVVDLLQRTTPDSVALGRGIAGVRRSESRRFVYADGNAFDHRGQLLSGSVIARAYSAEVVLR